MNRTREETKLFERLKADSRIGLLGFSSSVSIPDDGLLAFRF
jgi:hypothetical protein